MTRIIVYTTRGQENEVPDDYSSKLVKYIPAEVLAFFVSLYPLIPKEEAGYNWVRYLAVFLGVFGTIAYFYIRRDQKNPPKWFFYMLSAFSFLIWAIGTSSILTDMFKADEVVGKIILTIGVFAIPLFDELLNSIA